MTRLYSKNYVGTFINIFNVILGSFIGFGTFSIFELDPEGLKRIYLVMYLFGILPIGFLTFEYLLFKKSIKMRTGFLLSIPMYISFLVLWRLDAGSTPPVFLVWFIALCLVPVLLFWIFLNIKKLRNKEHRNY